MSIATSTIATMPEIQFASNGWQTTKFSSDRTVVEINWRTATIEVVRMTAYEMTSIPTRIYNGDASWFRLTPGTGKTDIVEILNHYAKDIVDIMAGYEHGPIDQLSRFASVEIADKWRYICQGLEWALDYD